MVHSATVMPTTPIPELEPARKPEPELKKPRKPEPEIKQPIAPPKPEVGDDQGDSGPDRENPITEHSKRAAQVDPGDAHIGATETQVTNTPAPSGESFDDEPKQG
jgi:hypothetical protein